MKYVVWVKFVVLVVYFFVNGINLYKYVYLEKFVFGLEYVIYWYVFMPVFLIQAIFEALYVFKRYPDKLIVLFFPLISTFLPVISGLMRDDTMFFGIFEICVLASIVLIIIELRLLISPLPDSSVNSNV
jgi:hypothetical protein